MSKTMWGVIIAIVVIISGAYILSSTSSAPDTEKQNVSQEQNTIAKGRAVFSVTDAAANMSAISEINMKVKSVEVHNSTGGWITVSTISQTYNLLALNAENKSELLTDVNIQAGTYDQIRLIIDTISVKTKTGATKEAKLPSGELKINANVVVTAGATTSINFDFLADKSLHTTGNGSYIFAPVVKTEVKSNTEIAIVGVGSEVVINGGRLEDTNTVGMDIDGSVKLNFQIKSNQKLNIDSDDLIKVSL